MLTGAALVVMGGLVACRTEPKAAAGKPERHFLRGQIVSVDPSLGSILLAHEAIPGLMPAMTMEYKMADPGILSELHAGDRITADLLNDRDAAGPKNLRLTDVDVIAQARPDYKPPMAAHIPSVGEAVPDFPLLNQSGKKISLRQFRGQTLLMTFVYTRCPLADYCPRMSRNFAQIDKELAKTPGLYAKTHLLTVSFDPAYDTPKVLRSYGEAYTGRYTEETFAHWDFAAPSEAELPKLEQWFGVGVTANGNQLQHSLSTVIVGPDGKVVAFYPTNEWTPAEALDTVRKTAG